ncbi:MAG: hypothetical protein K9K64_10380 [Desulfohalobiaceae bacterium]|nr:hypothetical protein [Desulfohalobiaceae bacterium]
MFCRKCKYTSFDYLDSCPECGFDWRQQKKDLNLDWLLPPSSKAQFSLLGKDQEGPRADSRPEQPPAESDPLAGKQESPSSRERKQSGQTQVPEKAPLYGQEDIEQETNQEARTVREPESRSRSQGLAEDPPVREVDLQEIEYSFEDPPEAPEEEASSRAADRSPGEDADGRPILLDEAEIEIELEEETKQPEPPGEKQGRPPASADPGGVQEDEDDQWAALLEEIDIESDSPKDPDKAR